jgi:hypothetical protein
VILFPFAADDTIKVAKFCRFEIVELLSYQPTPSTDLRASRRLPILQAYHMQQRRSAFWLGWLVRSVPAYFQDRYGLSCLQ